MLLAREGHTPLTASQGQEALAIMAREQPPLVLLDVQMPGMDGLEVLRCIKAQWPHTLVIVMTAYGTVATAMEAMRAGAFEYLGKPLELQPLRALVRRALQQAELRRDPAVVLTGQDERIGGERELIGQSAAMQEVFKLMSLVAGNDLTVLVTGESGVGKELVARGIHAFSNRGEAPFVAVNCAAIPQTLLESELFGHERGAFTGAAALRLGRFEAAAGGTLFLDEIGELPHELQGKLLRVLQERHFERLGSNAPIELRARILAATNRDLGVEVDEGRFREDLFHRINLVQLCVPPLRKRGGDVDLLAKHFLIQANRELGRAIQEIDAEAMARLRAYDWPGNVRELENTIRRSALLTQGVRLNAADLALPSVDKATGDPAARAGSDLDGLREAARRALEQLVRHAQGHPSEDVFHRISGAVEQELIAEALRLTSGNQVAASRLLGVSRTTLRKKRSP
jgi:DNA-binding NtrC family response regulator